MTYSLFSKQGEVQALSSAMGWLDTYKFIKSQSMPLLQTFIENGETKDIPQVLKDLNLVIPLATNQNIRSVLEGLKEGLSKCQGWAVISD